MLKYNCIRAKVCIKGVTYVGKHNMTLKLGALRRVLETTWGYMIK